MRVIAIISLLLTAGCSFVEGGPVPCLDVRIQICPVKAEPLSRQSSTH